MSAHADTLRRAAHQEANAAAQWSREAASDPSPAGARYCRQISAKRADMARALHHRADMAEQLAEVWPQPRTA